jgi:hypothetical protein
MYNTICRNSRSGRPTGTTGQRRRQRRGQTRSKRRSWPSRSARRQRTERQKCRGQRTGRPTGTARSTGSTGWKRRRWATGRCRREGQGWKRCNGGSIMVMNPSTICFCSTVRAHLVRVPSKATDRASPCAPEHLRQKAKRRSM